MADHLTAEQLESYRRRKLPGGDLLRADDHLAECAACRAALASHLNAAAAFMDVKASLNEAAHLQFEEMESYLDGQAPAEVRAMVEAHTGTCARCARELTDLRAFISMPAEAPAKLVAARRGWFSAILHARAYRVGAAIALLLIAVAVIKFSSRTPVPAATEHLSKVGSPASSAANLPPSELRDGSRQILIGPGAQVRGLDDFPADYRQRISDALIAGHLELPSAVESAWAQRELSSARARFPDSHLLLGVLDLHARRLSAARAEFSALSDENHGSAAAASLLHKLDELTK